MAGAPNDTNKQGHDETNKVEGEGPIVASSTRATAAGAQAGYVEGSDTRAGDREGGSASGDDEGRSFAAAERAAEQGDDNMGPHGDPAEGKRRQDDLNPPTA